MHLYDGIRRVCSERHSRTHKIEDDASNSDSCEQRKYDAIAAVHGIRSSSQRNWEKSLIAGLYVEEMTAHL